MKFLLPVGIMAAVAFLGTLIASMVLGFQYKKIIFETSIFRYQNRDLNTKLIYKITQRDYCEVGEETLILGTWFGSINKCKCYERILNTECKPENSGCYNISGDPKNYTKYDGKEFCVERKGKTYKELIKANQIKNKSEPCPEYYKSCGIIDTLERKLCVENGEECPITIKDIEPKTNLFNKYYKENPQLFLNDENENNNMIISLIEVGDDYPCMNYTEKVWVTYDGNDRNNVTSCSDIDGKKLIKQFVHIEGYKIDKVDFYKNNGLEDYISIGLKETPIPVNLYGRVLFGLYYNDETINYERMIEIQKM